MDEEIAKIQREAPAEREFRRAINQIESSFYDRMERVGNFGGVGDQLNGYYLAAGNPGYFNEDLVAIPRAVARRTSRPLRRVFLPLDKRVELIVEPKK